MQLFYGCHSYIQRTVLRSISKMGEAVLPPPHMITTSLFPDARLAVSWAGHSTVLIQIYDKLIITDPLLFDNVGMVVKREVKSGLDPAVLEKLDFTLISHLHFDHLDYGSIDVLPKDGVLIFPYGISGYIPDFDFQDAAELKTWDVFEKDSVRITAVPAQHFTSRYNFDRNWTEDSGYTGYVIEYKDITVFFAGDTGYNPEFFKEIGNRFKIDLAIIPIAPSWSNGFGNYVHTSPLGAIEVFKDVKAQYMVPIHFGALVYGSTADPLSPLYQLNTLAASGGIYDRITALEVGEQRIIY
ncbi:MAG: MBL fold metallo-hydrolase [Bacteroidetes bacterium]|nr:MBL fold metallo-hydrolase [Bacteroidota bacterium]